MIFRRSEIHGLLDGIIYGALVGIGFAFVEDIVYYLQSLQAGQLGVTFFLRGIMAPFAHPLFTAAPASASGSPSQAVVRWCGSWRPSSVSWRLW